CYAQRCIGWTQSAQKLRLAIDGIGGIRHEEIFYASRGRSIQAGDFSEMLVQSRHDRPPGARRQKLRRVNHVARAAFGIDQLNSAGRLWRALTGINLIGSLESKNHY